MKKIFTLALLALVAVGASADTKKDAAQSNKPVFTTIKAVSRTRTVAVHVGTTQLFRSSRPKSSRLQARLTTSASRS